MEPFNVAAFVQTLNNATTYLEQVILCDEYSAQLSALPWRDIQRAGYPETLLSIGAAMDFAEDEEVGSCAKRHLERVIDWIAFQSCCGPNGPCSRLS